MSWNFEIGDVSHAWLEHNAGDFQKIVRRTERDLHSISYEVIVETSHSFRTIWKRSILLDGPRHHWWGQVVLATKDCGDCYHAMVAKMESNVMRTGDVNELPRDV